jgi:hypothetical protein
MRPLRNLKDDLALRPFFHQLEHRIEAHIFVENDLAIITADHGPQLVIEELLPAVFDIFRESDPVADCQRDLLWLEHTELPCLIEWQPLLDAVLSDDDSSLLPAKDFPCSPLLNRFSGTSLRTAPLAIL